LDEVVCDGGDVSVGEVGHEEDDEESQLFEVDHLYF
jgi:hypothetical protein